MVILMFVLVIPFLALGIISIILFADQKKKAAKMVLILAGVYLVVGLGICGALLN